MNRQFFDIILPVFHEEQTIASVIDSIENSVKTPHQLLFIYDDPKDPTLQKIPKNKHFLKIHNTFDKGVVNAMKTGFIESKAPYLVLMMADGSDNPKDVDTMITKLKEGNDIVCASRYSSGGQRNGGPLLKGLLSRIASLSLYAMGVPTHDSTNAFKAFKKSVLNDINIESKGGFELPLEIIVKAWAKGYKIGEISTIWKEREKGSSKFHLLKWLPQYLKWYLLAIQTRWKRGI